jgi:xanthine dehydrogenase iron-sulfur cluster and FAD-binding subunit A
MQGGAYKVHTEDELESESDDEVTNTKAMVDVEGIADDETSDGMIEPDEVPMELDANAGDGVGVAGELEAVNVLKVAIELDAMVELDSMIELDAMAELDAIVELDATVELDAMIELDAIVELDATVELEAGGLIEGIDEG